MSDKVVPIPTEYRRPRFLQGGKVWESPEPSDLMVWEVCPYTRGGGKMQCQGCPSWIDDERRGKIKRGCRALAEEACRVVMAIQKHEAADAPLP